MENKFQPILGGRAQAVETTSWNQTKYNLKHVGLDMPRHASTSTSSRYHSLSVRSARRGYSTTAGAL